MSDPGLFDAIIARGPVREAVASEAWIAAMLEAEAALARAEARAGVIPGAEAEEIAVACVMDGIDAAALSAGSADSGNPVVPLVAAVRARLDRPAADHVHYGATSQDILDTAAMLVVRRALGLMRLDLEAAGDAAAQLATQHRDTLMSGRTLLQQALPTTCGAKAAAWLSGLDAAAERIDWYLAERVAAQLGGAVGTLAALGDAAPAVASVFGEELGLKVPAVAWHAERSRIADLAGVLGTTATTIGKPALDIVLMAQTEVGEVREGRPGRGGSSTLPQKHNPVAAVAARACTLGVPAEVAGLLAATVGEQERAAGAWHAEWQPLITLLTAVGSGAAWLRESLEGLEIDAVRMRANLDATGGLALAERVALALTPAIGRLRAQQVVAKAADVAMEGGRSFAEALEEREEVRSSLGTDALVGLLDPAGYLGTAAATVDAAVAHHEARRGHIAETDGGR